MKVHDCLCDVNHAWCLVHTQSVSALAWQVASRNQSRPHTSYIQTSWALVSLHSAELWLHVRAHTGGKIRKYCEIGSAALKLHTCICIYVHLHLDHHSIYLSAGNYMIFWSTLMH